VLDSGNARFAVYDTAGRLVATRPRDVTAAMSPWPGGFDREGRLIDLGATRREDGVRTMSLVRFGVDWSTRDTMDLPSVPVRSFGSLTSGDESHRRVREAPVPFLGRAIWAVDPRGYAWVAVSDEYRIEQRSFDGQVHRVLALDNVPPRISRAEKDAILENYAWFEAQGGTLDRSLIPDEHSDLLNFFMDDEDHLWVAPAYEPHEHPPLDVFDRSGRYLGQLRAPVSILTVPSPVVRKGMLAAIVRDRDGVESVVLLRISRAQPPAG
jgi:hypothetical protein